MMVRLRVAAAVLAVAMFAMLIEATSTNDYHRSFMSCVNRTQLQSHLAAYALAPPHRAGTQADYDLAVWTQTQWLQYGLNATILPFSSLINEPVDVSVSIVSGAPAYTAGLREPVIAADRTSGTYYRNQSFNGPNTLTLGPHPPVCVWSMC
jgi:hypothetical protein